VAGRAGGSGTVGAVTNVRSWGRLPLAARFLVVNQFGVWFGFFLVVPLLATHGTGELGISAAAVGLVIGMRTFSQQGPMFVAGLVADRIGLRKALLIGSVARVGSLLTLAAAHHFWSLLLAVGLFGLAGSLIAPATRAYLGIAAGELRPEAFGLFNVASVLGSVLGPLLAVAASPLGFAVTCYLSAGVFGAMAVAQVFILPPAPPAEIRRLGPAVRGILGERRLVTFTLTASGSYAVWNQSFLLLPLEASRLVGDDAVGSGGVFTLLAVTTLALQFRMVALGRRLGAVPASVLGIALTGIGFAGPLLSRAGWADVHPAVVPLVLLGAGTMAVAAGTALLNPAEQDLVARLALEGQQAAAFGLSGFFSGLAATVVSPIVGWADDVGWRAGMPWIAPALVCAVGVLTAVAVRLTSRDADPECVS
jgi:MFS family permease